VWLRPKASILIRSFLFRIWEYRLKENPILRKPVFLVGCPRSGTGITARLLARHPSTAVWSEASQVWDPFHYYDPYAEHHWSVDMVTQQDATRLHRQFEFYRRMNRKERFANKHPRNSVRIEYIDAIFPDALFIHVIRDGRAVANSIVRRIQKEPFRQNIPFGNFCKPPNWRKWLRDDPVEQAALQWKEIVGFARSKKKRLGGRYHEFRYEDMCLMPQEVFASVFQFAQLPVSRNILSRIPKRLTNMNFKYKEQLAPTQIDTINLAQKALLKDLHYDV
jgi:hypothetical protein